MTIKKRKQPTPGFRLPPPFNPMTGERERLQYPGIDPNCAMMQIAEEDTRCNYVVCRGFDPREKAYFEEISVAKPYHLRMKGVYQIGEVYPAFLPLSAGGERSGKIVWTIGQNPGRVEGDACRGQPYDLTEEIVHLKDEDDKYINWLLIDSRPAIVYFELLEALVQWSGDIVNAARKVWDPTANAGDGGFTSDCDDIILVGDLNEVGHNAGKGGMGTAEMKERENTPYWVGVIFDLCCLGDEQETCS